MTATPVDGRPLTSVSCRIHVQCSRGGMMGPADGGKLFVLTAPLTEIVEGTFVVQMSCASLPKWMEFVLSLKNPGWRRLARNPDGSAASMPAGLRVLEKALTREYDADDIVACYPDDVKRFVGPRTRVVAVSAHNPLGVTFATGLFASVFGNTREPINSHYARALFAELKQSPYRESFKVIVGGTGGWQIIQANASDELGIDCVVEGRSESDETMALFRDAVLGKSLPRTVAVSHPMTREAILLPDRRTTYGAIELTTGCGRRCQFCGPDLNPQLDLPKDKILAAVRATVRDGGRRVSLATEDTFIWGQVRTETPFYFPNREALLDLFSEIAHTPGIEEVVLTHCTIAPFVVDPTLIAKLSAILLDKSPYRMPRSSRPDKRVLIPLIGLETGSTRLAKRIMPSKGVPFPIDDWPSVVLEGLAVANANDWYPMLTLMVGSPDETDDDVRATLDLVYEIERRGLFAFLIPSIFTPLPSTRMAAQRGVTESRHLTPLQWQLVLKCWKMNMDRSAYLTMAPVIWRLGALVAWALRLRRITGPNSTWPMLMLSGMVPESVLGRFGKIHLGGLRDTKSRAELIARLRPGQRRYLREDAGDRQSTAAAAAAPAAVV